MRDSRGLAPLPLEAWGLRAKTPWPGLLGLLVDWLAVWRGARTASGIGAGGALT